MSGPAHAIVAAGRVRRRRTSAYYEATATLRSKGDLLDFPLRDVTPSLLKVAQPVRLVRSHKGQQQHSGEFWAVTNPGLVPFESGMERTRICLADFDPCVRRILGQPMLLTLVAPSGQVLRHVPDLALLGRGGDVHVVDVKPEHRLDDPLVRRALSLTQQALKQRGWSYSVWTGEDPVLVNNVSFLSAYRNPGRVDPEDVAAALAFTRSVAIDSLNRPVTFGQLLACASPSLAGRFRSALLHLLWSGQLRTDLSVNIGLGSVIEVPGAEQPR